MLQVKHLNRSLLGSVDLAPSDSVPVTKRVPVEPEVHASLLRLFALPSEPAANKTTGTVFGVIVGEIQYALTVVCLTIATLA